MGNFTQGIWASGSVSIAEERKRKLVGKYGEDYAVQHLQEAGWKILARNWRCARGELDVIAQHDQTIVFVEVKTRTSHHHGHPLESITPAKLKRIRLLATHWLAQQTLYWPHLRIDVIAVEWSGDTATNIHHVQGVE